MAKTESTLKNMFISLLAIAVIAGASLGLVYNFTKAPIALAKQAKQQDAIKMVVPAFDNDPAAEMTEVTSAEGFTLKLFPAKKAGQLVGTAVETMTNKGFGGEIRVMVGFAPDGTIINYKVLDHKETPGLGSKMDEWFRTSKASTSGADQSQSSFASWLYGLKKGAGGDHNIIDKNPKTDKLSVTKDGGEIDGITAATISSRAFLDAIRIAYLTYCLQPAPTANDSITTNTAPQEGGQQ